MQRVSPPCESIPLTDPLCPLSYEPISSPARPEDRSPETEDSPSTPIDPFSPHSMSSKQASQSPTLFKRFRTRLRSMSRGKDEQPKISVAKKSAPPVPIVPIAKDFAVAHAQQPSTRAARPVGPVRRLSKGNLLAAFGNKSTPSLVISPTEAPAPERQPSVPRRSSVPRLTVPLSVDASQSKDVDPALIPLPESPLVPPSQVEAPESSTESAKHKEQVRPTVLDRPAKAGLQDSSVISPGYPAQESPVSKRSAAQSGRSSKFFVGDSDDEDDDTRRFSVQNSSPISHRESPRQRSATTDDSPSQRPARRPTKPGAASTAEKRKTMFNTWRKSTDVASALSDLRAHKRGPSIESTSSTDSAGASKRVNPVSPTMHSGGFAHQEEKIKDPESRALTEIAFM
ncbi:hypothetical protein CALVIDRAFT_90921 [Calocera viscosa TUFC12733]|uniref:Uncharacterized protein n=1 Tax=Calocera viscosa (strain TUFC12733) TaxID=1330018 RepID=A0A167MSV0_CALVF|nr:hypothetical protein CALVIDRAFT_90921 [Calocera viscosa TUFC12733]